MQHQLTVTGMTCGHCEMAVTRALKRLDPVAEVKVDRANNHVEVRSDVERAKLVAAIEEEGYAVAG